MFNSEMVTEYLQKIGQYPSDSTENDYGLKIMLENNRLLLMGNPSALIDLADLLVSLALSGQNIGQHWHIDTSNLVSEKSPISELILERTNENVK